MAKLNLENPTGLGEYIRMMIKSDAERIAFMNNPNAKIAPFLENKKVPDNVQIIPHFDTEFQTHMMIPWRDDVAKTELLVKSGQYEFPGQYSVLKPMDSEEQVREIAYNFRVGDYVLTRCG